jgi:integrase
VSNLHLIHKKSQLKNDKINAIVVEFIAGKSFTTRVSYSGTWANFYNWWITNYPTKPILEITPLNAQKFFIDYSERVGQGARLGAKVKVSKSTLKKVAATLASCWDAVGRELAMHLYNPFSTEFKKYQGSQSKNRRPTNITPYHKVLELLESPPRYTKVGLRDRAILACLYGGALRRGELTRLKMRHVKINQGNVSLVLLDTKNGDDVDQPIADEMCPAIIEYYNLRKTENPDPDAYFLISYLGQRHNPQEAEPISDSTLYKAFKYYCEQVGLGTEISPHSARATAITRLLDLGLPHREVREFSRHRSVVMVEEYDKKRGDAELNPASRLSFSNAITKKN